MSAHPDLGTRHLFASFARCRGVRDSWYVVADPAAMRPGERVSDAATIEHEVGWIPALVGAAGGVIAGALAGVVIHAQGVGPPDVTGVGRVVGLAVVGMLLGIVAAAVQASGPARRRRRRAEGRVLKIDPQEHDSWSFCEAVEQLTTTRAWSMGMVDQERVVPVLLWRVTSTWRHLAPLEADLHDARSHPGLADVIAQKSEEVADVRFALDAVRSRVVAMIAPAQQLDARERAQQAEATRKDAESVLRERLTGSHTPPADAIAEAEDRAGGVHASAVALNELLAETDRITDRLSDGGDKP